MGGSKRSAISDQLSAFSYQPSAKASTSSAGNRQKAMTKTVARKATVKKKAAVKKTAPAKKAKKKVG